MRRSGRGYLRQCSIFFRGPIDAAADRSSATSAEATGRTPAERWHDAPAGGRPGDLKTTMIYLAPHKGRLADRMAAIEG
jgi:hypothetical protein